MAQRRGSAPPPPGDKRKTVLYVSFGILALIAIIAVGVASNIPKVASVANVSAQLTVGESAPTFTLPTTDGVFDLSQADGEPVLLEIFATWCPHCQRETATLNEIYDTYKGKVHVVAVSGSPYASDGSTPQSQADVVNFIQKYSVRYPVAYDPTLGVANKYLQGGFPTIVVIGKDRKIVKFRDGEIPLTDLKKDLDAALQG
jgi:peroxiredoxin